MGSVSAPERDESLSCFASRTLSRPPVKREEIFHLIQVVLTQTAIVFSDAKGGFCSAAGSRNWTVSQSLGEHSLVCSWVFIPRKRIHTCMAGYFSAEEWVSAMVM